MNDHQNSLKNLISRYRRLEEKFLKLINSRRKEGEGKIVTVLEEHLFFIALDKLQAQDRLKLRDDLFYRIHDDFEIVDKKFERVYINKLSGKEGIVTAEDIIKYGNQNIWQDFGWDKRGKN